MDVTAIIPAHNEGRNIGRVLTTVRKADVISRTIVVSDGSTDDTVEVAMSFGVDVIILNQNSGKGFAMKAGLMWAVTPIILFLDADLQGIQPYHIDNLVRPIHQDMVDMTLGIFAEGRNVTDLAQRVAPFLTGQRGIKKCILDEICYNKGWPNGFGIELMLTQYAWKKGLKIKKVPLLNVSHLMKEEKIGLLRGLLSRAKMYWDIIKELGKHR